MNKKIWCTAYQAVQFLESEKLVITQKTISIWKSTGKISPDSFGMVCLDDIRNILIEKLHKRESRIFGEIKTNFGNLPNQLFIKDKVEKKIKTKEKPIKVKVNKTIKKTPAAKTNKIEKKVIIKKTTKKTKDPPKKNINNSNPVQLPEPIKYLSKQEPDDKDDRSDLLLMKLRGDAKRSVVNAKKAGMELAITRGSLLDREIVIDYINASISAHNNRLLNIPGKLSDWCISIVRANESDSTARVKLIQKFNKELSDILDSEKKEIKKYMKNKKQ